MTATWVQTARWQNTITLFEHSIRVTGDNPTLEVNLAYRLAKLGELDRAIHITESVFQRYPSYSQCALNLSSFFMQKKDFDRALEYLQKALALRPDRQDQILAYQGIVLKKAGRIQEAQRAFEQSLQINPNQPTALSELGEILFLQGRRTDGIALWEKALQTDPFSLKALENLAWTLAVCCQESVHNPKKAFAYAQRLAAAGPPTAKQMDILAAALAACGDYEAAVRRAQEALNLAETEPNAPSAEAIQERLTLYQNQKRFLDTSCGLWIQ
jgi:tetratricopeptide (TPR) repeat protein